MLKHLIYKMLEKEPFYAHFLLNCDVQWDTYGIPTAAVAVINNTITMVFNTKWMEQRTDVQKMDVIKHEVLHLVFSHLQTRVRDEDQNIHNVAEDCAINQYLTDVGKDGVILKKLEQMCGKKLTPFSTSDYYFNELMLVKQKMSKSPGGAGSTLDDHGFAHEHGDKNEAIVKGLVAKAGKDALRLAAGNAPKAVAEALQALGEAKLPWKSILRNFVMKQASNNTRLTTKKLNRRLPLPAPGRLRKRTLKLGVCLDSSGSVSDESYAAFLTEVASLSSACSDLWVLHADTQVHKVQHIKKKKDVDFTRHCAGGTMYQPAFDKCKELGVDAVVFFGDMDSADRPTHPGVPVLWVAVGQQEPPAKWGAVVRL